MSKILFITTRNILNTCGELRLIKNRTKTFYEKWDLTTDFIVICNKEKIRTNNEKMGSNSSVKPIPVNNYNPISIISALKKGRDTISNRLKREKYKCIVLSGTGTYSYLPMLKRMGVDIPIIADIHGAKEELIEFKDNNILKRIYKRLLYHYTKYSQNKYLKLFDGSFVVSNALADYLDKEYLLNDVKHYVVPCANESKSFNLELRELNRQYYRSKYGIDPNEILFIYSGGVSPWQCIDKSLKIFSDFKCLNSNINAKFLILSHHIEKVKSMIEGHNNIIVDRVNADEVGKVLCAGDYAFLIRDNFITNNVAYPNKFLEYVQSGMKIITTPYVFDVAQQVEDFDLGIIIDLDKDYTKKISNYVNNKDLDTYNKRKHLLKKISFEETLSRFVEDLKLNM